MNSSWQPGPHTGLASAPDIRPGCWFHCHHTYSLPYHFNKWIKANTPAPIMHLVLWHFWKALKGAENRESLDYRKSLLWKTAPISPFCVPPGHRKDVPRPPGLQLTHCPPSWVLPSLYFEDFVLHQLITLPLWLHCYIHTFSSQF